MLRHRANIFGFFIVFPAEISEYLNAKDDILAVSMDYEKEIILCALASRRLGIKMRRAVTNHFRIVQPNDIINFLMHISQIETWNFRNLKNNTIPLSPEFNLFVGLNGHGKTNLMEALYVVCFSKSFRTHQLAECIRHGENTFRVRCRIDQPHLDHILEVRLDPMGKTLLANEKSANISDFLQIVSMLCITADHLRVITEGPQARRRFFDGLATLFQPASLKQLAAYRRVIRQKTSLLREDRVSPSTLETWNRKLISEARLVVKQRKMFMELLSSFITECRFSGSPITIQYQPSMDENILSNESHAMNALARYSEREQIVGRSLLGPHLDQYHFFLDGKDVRRYASSGQKRSLLLNIYLGVMELFKQKKGFFPVVMIDDVDMELDLKRIQTFITCLDQKTQIFLSSSKAEIFDTLLPGRQIFHIEDGHIHIPI